MYNIFENIVNRKYIPYIENIIGILLRYLYLLYKNFRDQKQTQHCLIKNSVFILKEKNKFIKNIYKNESFCNINTSPQEYKKEPHLNSYFLFLLDKNFKGNLYYYN